MTSPTIHLAWRIAPGLFTPLALAALLGAPAAGLAGDPPADSPRGEAAPGPAAAPSPPPAPGEAPAREVKRVVYLPETVKQQLREEIKQEVLEQAKREGWAAPSAVPEWLRRFRPSGDVRGRFERAIFPSGNGVGQLFDFNAINTGRAMDVTFNDAATERDLNVDQNRTRPRLRARLGVDVEVTEGFSAGLRLASGETASPVSTNQTLGVGGGSFSRYQFWLDRAFIRYAPFSAARGVVLHLGRFENPFFATDLVWSDNVNFDGVALQVAGGDRFRPFLAAGAFPIYTTGFSFPAELPEKLPSRNRWLYASQLGATWKPAEGVAARLGAAFYFFHNVEGRPSAPCDTSQSSVTCNTDDDRPGFAQKGNTYRLLRTPNDLALQREAAGGSQYQFFGLASRFRELTLTGQLDVRIAPGVAVRVDGEYVRNLAFRRSAIDPVALNNLVPCADRVCPFGGGNQGYLGRLTLGSPTQNLLGDWSVGVAYRRLESDAVVDAFTDSDFGLGGTNLKGYVLAASLCLADHVTALARWMSADQVAGPPYRADVLHLDLQARF